MSDADLIAAFLAKNNVTKVETGARTMSEREMYRATGYESETVKVFFVRAHDECGVPFTARINADSMADAEVKFKRKYPEAMVFDVSRDNPADTLDRLESY